MPDDRRILVLTRGAGREVDAVATERYAIPSIVLMENAARQLADHAQELIPPGSRFLVVCGPGNNGGDGLACARHLALRGHGVTVLLGADRDRLKGDARTNLVIAGKIGLSVLDGAGDPNGAWASACERGAPGVIIDALLGTGADRPVEPPISTLIDLINGSRASGARVVAADLPSGLDADTGKPLGTAVRADRTVTFVAHKPGFLTLAAQEYIGEVSVADIGLPRSLIEDLGSWRDPPAHAPEGRPGTPGDNPDPAHARRE